MNGSVSVRHVACEFISLLDRLVVGSGAQESQLQKDVIMKCNETAGTGREEL